MVVISLLNPLTLLDLERLTKDVYLVSNGDTLFLLRKSGNRWEVEINKTSVFFNTKLKALQAIKKI